MKLYLLLFRHTRFYVEAPSYAAAIVAWRVACQNRDDVLVEDDDEPESCECVHDAPVIR